jgi:hypothetical protein
MGARKYSDDRLVRAVAESGSMREVLMALGLAPYGGNYESVRRQIVKLGLRSEHLRTFTRRRGITSFADEEIVKAVKESRSLSQALKTLGVRPGGNQSRLRERIQRLGIDTSHMVGQGWRRGSRAPLVRRVPIEQYLTPNKLIKTSVLRQRLLEDGLKERRCEGCSLETWEGRPIPLELDHINGRRHDNRLENLRVLCPNCHAQTSTYRGRNIGVSGL